MHQSRMEYQIQGARKLTGGKYTFVYLHDKRREVCTDVSKRDALNDFQLSMTPKTGDDEEKNIDPNDNRPLLEFSTTSYAMLEREQTVDLKVKRRGPIDVEFRFRSLTFTHSLNHLCMYIL
jgi:hypothetical protein